MGSEIVYCDHCGERLHAQEFAQHRAIIVLNKSYCIKCKEGALHAVAPEKTEAQPKSLSESFLKRLSRRNKRRNPKATPYPRTAPSRTSGNNSSFWLAGVFAFIALVLILVVILADR